VNILVNTSLVEGYVYCDCVHLLIRPLLRTVCSHAAHALLIVIMIKNV